MIAENEKNHILFIKFILFIFSFFFLLFIFTANYFLEVEKKLNNKIYLHVYLDDVNIGNKTKQEVSNIYHKKNANLNEVTVFVLYNNKAIATLSAQTIKLHSNADEIIERAYLIGRTPQTTSQIYQKITSLLNLGRFTFYSHISYDKQAINDFVDSLEERYNQPARNALFSFNNGRVVNFRPEEKGLKINSEKFIIDFENTVNQLNNKIENTKVLLTDQIIDPEITLAKANQFGIEESIGEGKSDFTHSIPERIHNIVLASSQFNGVLIPKDKIFSFNEAVGDISSLTGYKPAYIIKSGKTVLGDGGGICQVSTTLFRAALNTGLPIIERRPHAYRVSYYENDLKPGFDATVFAPSVDLKIKNNSPAYILIQSEIDKEKNLLFFKLYGKKDSRRVEISPVTVYDTQPPPEAKYQEDPILKKGVVKQIDFAAWGAKVYFTYKVIRNDQVLTEDKFFSAYKPWQAVYLQGTAD